MYTLTLRSVETYLTRCSAIAETALQGAL